MKDRYPNNSLTRFCRLLGITRQAYYKHNWHQQAVSIEEELVIKEVKQIRQHHRAMGGRKLFELLQPFMLEHQIKMGRDALFDVLASHGLLVRKKRRRIFTTNSYHWLRKWNNLIKDFAPTAPNQLYVSDITYWKIRSGYVYISLITDAYSHKIVGYHVAPTLATVETICALKMALHQLGADASHLIHHSDRGVQYCSEEYVQLLQLHQIKISMTESSEPTDNAIAERINGILKQEYLEHYEVKNIAEAKELLSYAVKLYNEERPHLSIGMQTPNIIHELKTKTENLWKKKSINEVSL
jgi:putative transposase